MCVEILFKTPNIYQLVLLGNYNESCSNLVTRVDVTGLLHGMLGIISMKCVLPPGPEVKKPQKEARLTKHPTGYETKIFIKWISLKIDEHSGFHSALHMCQV